MQEMTACRILERVCTHRKLVLINNYSSVCFLYLWLSLLTQHCLHFPADTRHWFQLLSVPLFLLNSRFLFWENVSSAFILTAFFPSPSGFLPSLPLWLGCLWIKALRVAWRQTGFLIGVPVQKCQETWSTSAVPALLSLLCSSRTTPRAECIPSAYIFSTCVCCCKAFWYFLFLVVYQAFQMMKLKKKILCESLSL